MKILRHFFTLLLFFCVLPRESVANQYVYNDESSEVMFDLKHLGLVTASGVFNSFEGNFKFNAERIEDSEVKLSISTASVESGLETRDESLKSENFFWSERFPHITFESVAIKNVKGREFMIYGNLTIKDITRAVIFETKLLSDPADLGDGQNVAFYTETFIKRKDFNLGTNKWTDPVLWITDEQLKISLNVEGIPANFE